MKKFFTVFVTVVLTAAITFSLTVAGIFLFFPKADGISDTLAEIKSYIDRHAVFEFSEDEAEKAAISAYLSGIEDDYTQFWTKAEYDEYLRSTQGHYAGIGLSLQSTQTVSDGIFVYRVLGNSPAEKAGIRAGDLITAVDDVSVLDRNYNQVVDEMKRDAGQSLSLTLLRGEETLTVSVVYSDFVQSYVDYRMIDDIGFIRIHSFTALAADEFQKALNDLLSQGANGFVFDLRNNLGGSLDAVEDILELLIPKGEEMVVIQYKNSEKVFYSELEPKTQVPMVVLQNKSSASGSELMASCLRDVNGSKLIGTTSYGKGIGQTTFRLSDGSAVKMTTFHYLTKARNYYHGTGLEPDTTVYLDVDQEKYFYALNETNDPQLQEALKIIKTQIAG